MKKKIVLLAVGTLVLAASSCADAQVSVSVGLNPFGWGAYTPPVVYQPPPYYAPPPVVYVGGGAWGGGREDHRGGDRGRDAHEGGGGHGGEHR
jgi:hypothetical protein